MRWSAALVAALLLLASCSDATTETEGSTTVAPTDQAPLPNGGTITTVPDTDDGPVAPWPTEIGDRHRSWSVEIVARLPHDPTAFTQGLEYVDGTLLESTGRYGESTLRITDPATGVVLDRAELDPTLFGEGLTVVDSEIIQLTWRAGRALRYDLDLRPIGEFAYDGEGWGICYDGADLWTSDGSATLTRRRPDDFTPLGSISVTREGRPVERLNELECIDDRVVANVWQTDEIVVIDPATGVVDATIDAAALRAEIRPVDAGAVLNGIADRGDGTLLLGGKLWPNHFVVELAADD